MATVTYTRVTVKADFQAQTYLGRTAQVSDVVALDNGGFAFAYSVIDSSTGDRSPMVEFYDAKYGSVGNPFFVSSASTVSLTGQISIAKLDSGNVAVGYTGAGQMQAAIYTDTGAVVDSHVPFTAYGATGYGIAANGVDNNFRWSIVVGSGTLAKGETSSSNDYGYISSAGSALSAGPITDIGTAQLSDGGNMMAYIMGGRAYLFSAGKVDALVGAVGQQSAPEVAALKNGHSAVVYKDNSWGEAGLTLRIFNETGQPLVAPIRVDTKHGRNSVLTEFDPDVTALDNGFILVTWTSVPVGSVRGEQRGIYGRLYDAAGKAVAIDGTTKAFLIDGSATEQVSAASVAALVSGRFVTTWTDATNGGPARINAQVDEIERHTKGNDSAETLTGDGMRDRIWGYGGNDTIRGLGGDDVISAGDGNDKAYGGSGKDTITGGNGNDKLFGDGSADKLDGGAGDDQLDGGSNNDTLHGGAGKDTLIGGTGNDKLYGDTSADTLEGDDGNDALDGGSGNDVLRGGAGTDKLLGGSGSDKLYGESGTDSLYGGAGADKLNGGSGADAFIYKSVTDSTTAASGRDTIYDFLKSQGDRIDLSAIDANSVKAGNQAFTFIGTKAFSKTAGELRYDKKASDTYITGDVNGDGKADFSIHSDDAIAFAKGDFLL